MSSVKAEARAGSAAFANTRARRRTDIAEPRLLAEKTSGSGGQIAAKGTRVIATMATSPSSTLSATTSSTSPSEAEGTSRHSDSDTTTPRSPLAKKKRPRHIDSKYQPEWSLKYQGIKL